MIINNFNLFAAETLIQIWETINLAIRRDYGTFVICQSHRKRIQFTSFDSLRETLSQQKYRIQEQQCIPLFSAPVVILLGAIAI